MDTCWKELIQEEMKERNETFADLESCTLSDGQLTTQFDSDISAGIEGVPFTAWTAKTVYFPVRYDGAEWVGSVSRHPDGQATEHQGGGQLFS